MRAIPVRCCLMLLALLATTFSAAAQSFDCAKATTPYEKLICSDQELGALDSKLAAAYKAAMARLSPEGKKALVASQSSWLRHSRNVSQLDAESVKAAYRERLAQLERPLETVGPFKIQWVTMYKSSPPGTPDPTQPTDSEDDGVLGGNVDYTFPRIESPATADTEKWNLFIESRVRAEAGKPDPDTDTSVSTTFTYASADVVSAFLETMSMSKGAAHPNHGSSGSIYVFKLGRELTAADLFNPQSTWKDFLHKKMRAKAAKDDWAMYDGSSSPETDVSHWTLSKAGLTLNFAPYEVSAYAAGEQELALSWSELKPYLNTPPPFPVPLQ